MWVIVLTIPLLAHAQGLLVIQNEDVSIDYSVTNDNHCQRDTHRIQIYHGVTISDCVTECGLRSHCKALNYHGQMNLCELFTKAETEFVPGGCIHVEQKDIHMRKSPCGTGCEYGRACDIKTNTCTIKECMYFPELLNGVAIGNRKDVGMKISTKCYQGFKHKNGIKQSTCKTNGKWNRRIECSGALQNLALGSAAYQTDTNGVKYANLAVDGNTNGNLFASQSCTHTHTTTNASWEVDLAQLYAIDHVTVYGRTDCCAERLRDVQLYIGVNQDDYVMEGFHSGKIPIYHTFHLTSPVIGRWVKITRSSNVNGTDDQLTLCEVEVMGSDVSKVVCSSGSCYEVFIDQDLLGYDLGIQEGVSFDECSTFCETTTYKSFLYCFYKQKSCICKTASVYDGRLLNYHAGCNVYNKFP